MNRVLKKTISILLFSLLFICNSAFAAELQVTSVEVKGNINVNSDYILGTVETKSGEPLDREKLQRDIENIYELGFFSTVDMELFQLYGGVGVTFVVNENPVVESISFSGNTIYKEEDLIEVIFTKPGSVFNRVFFRNDLDRVQEKYNKDGYVMVRIADVSISRGNIFVKIIEPRIGDIIIQGNAKTKTKIISREIKLKKGDIFNATLFRHQLGRLHNLGYFDDISIGFEPGDEPDTSDIILSVKEKKTSSIGFNVGYGSDGGFSGGVTYNDINWAGLGHIAEVGFELGMNEQYWISYTSPYMDRYTYAWKVGAYRRYFEERYYFHNQTKQFEYDETMKGIYFGFGKKFGGNENFSWFMTLDWKDVSYDNMKNEIPGYHDDLTMWGGKNFTTDLTLAYSTLDPYVSYSKGFVSEVFLSKAYSVLGGEFDYLKYWLQLRYYYPFFLEQVFGDLFDIAAFSEEIPVIFATRFRIGSSNADNLPAFARYSLGGENTLRGYHSRTFEGNSMILANAELRIPIQSIFSIVGFYDIGNAGNDISYFSDLKSNYGFGVRVNTPMGNLRLDYAMGGDENRFYFSFGEMF
ncbi:MAG: BamA/TamA family outer membrane protein [Synergistaceae bacterium]|nr:BamA/TamA family outer membrane protein [Synergistaceae bacterium]